MSTPKPKEMTVVLQQIAPLATDVTTMVNAHPLRESNAMVPSAPMVSGANAMERTLTVFKT